MTFSGDEMRHLRKFKKAILDVLFLHCETFYIHCMPHESLVLGKRGLLKKEQTEGLILVFGPYSTRNLTWDDDSLQCEMQFSRWEFVQIPFDCIVRMFDKSGQVIMQWALPEAQEVSGPDLKLHVSDSDPKQDIQENASENTPRSAQKSAKRATRKKSASTKEDNVIEVDFSQKNKT